MRIDKAKVEVAMAKSCLNPFQVAQLAQCQYQTFRNAITGSNCKPATVGRIAAALGVDVTEIIATEKGES